MFLEKRGTTATPDVDENKLIQKLNFADHLYSSTEV